MGLRGPACFMYDSYLHGKLGKGALGRGLGRKDQDDKEDFITLNAAMRKAVSQGFGGFVL